MLSSSDPSHRHALAIEHAARAFESAPPEEILTWALDSYPARIVLACSFGGPSGMVTLDMTMRIAPGTPVYYLDTSLLFPETHALVGIAAERYGITPIAVRAELNLEQQSRLHGEALWERDPDRCCGLRKVAPQRAFLQNYDAWISSIRRDQTGARRDTPVVQWDDRFGLVKINPLATWDERMVWTYINAHGLPYNDLHDRNYPSLGCIPCTRAIRDGEDLRAGRWSGRAKAECGLHA
jgi:phosphoadenosine phosphosulfate reductase